MEELTAGVVWIAVIVGAIVSIVLGAIWYSPKVFGKKWAEGVGISDDESSGMPIPAMILQAGGIFLFSWIVGITAAANELLTIILIAVTIIVLQISSGLFCQKSGNAIAIEAGFMLAMTIVMIIFQGIF